MPTDANELTDGHLELIEGYMRGVAKGNQRPRGLPLHWLVEQWPTMDSRLWDRWAKIGERLLADSRVGELEAGMRTMSVGAEHGRRCMALAVMWRNLELSTVSHYMETVEDMASGDEDVDKRVQLKATALLLNRLEPGYWTGGGKAPEEEEVAEPAPASAQVRALGTEAFDALDDEQRAEVAALLEAEANADAERERREKKLRKILDGRE